MTSALGQVHTGRVYAYDNGAVAPVDRLGSFENNSAIWTTAAPRARAATHSPLSDALTTVLPGLEEAAQQAGTPAGKYIVYGAKALGTLDSTYTVGQHVWQGNGAETVSAGAKVGGGLAGAYAGAKAIAPVGAFWGPPGAKVGGVAGAVIGGAVGANTAEALAEKLTGGPTPDKLGPPLTLPNRLKLEPTVVTAQGDRYALVNVQGKYSWFGINDNPALPKRYIEVVQGAKVAELTRSYLDASGFPEQVERHNAELAEQQRTSLREQFRRSKTDDTNSLGPDGQPWGTPSRTAPNATTEWALSSQPGQWLHTTRIHSGADTETRITKSVDTARWQVVSETVHERHLGAERLVSTTDTLSGRGWRFDRASGQMQAFTLDEKAAAQAREAPAVQNHRNLNAQELHECHQTQARQMVQSMRSVCALATGQEVRVNGESVPTGQWLDPQQRVQAIEESMGQFRRASAELIAAREVMRERGMALPEVTDLPDLTDLREQALRTSQPTAELTTQQLHHLQLAQARTAQLYSPPEVGAPVMVRT